MLSFGRSHCTFLESKPPKEALGATYYDAIYVYHQIAQYTGDSAWLSCAASARDSYRDAYVIPNAGNVPGYWNFSKGLREDWEVNHDAASRDAAILLARDAAYCGSDPLAWSDSWELSRESAYCLMALLNSEATGEAERPRRSRQVAQVLGHLSQWFITKDARAPQEWKGCGGKYYYKPFMVGLSLRALIRYWEATKDNSVIAPIRIALDEMWKDAWVPADQSFWYENCKADPSDPWPAAKGSPDLNMLIGPAYQWMFERTGVVSYRDKADAIFVGGVTGAWLSGAKQFNQSYLWSFDYVRWRSEE